MAPRARKLLLLGPSGVAVGLSSLAFGYYDSSIWAPAGVVLAGVLVALVVADGWSSRPAAAVALGGLAALGLWSLLSSTWAPSSAQAFVDGNLVLVYALLLAVLLQALRDRADATWLLAAATVATGALGVVIVGRLAFDDGAASLFLGGRLNEPLGYTNGQGSVFMLAVFPALALAEQRRSRALAGLGAGAAALFGGLALLSISRGVLLGAIAGLVVVLVLVPGRLRRAGLLLVAGAALLIAVPALLDVYDSRAVPADLDATIAAAGRRLVLAAVVAGLAWAALVDVRARLPRRVATGMRTGWATALAVGALALLVVGVASAGAIADRVDREYDSFVALGATQAGVAPTSSRLVSGGGNRYDYWRVAVDVWEDHPVEGIGAGGWVVPWFAERATAEDVRQPHSLPLETLAELGVIGVLLLGLFVGGVGWAAVAGARRAAHRRQDAPLLVAGTGLVAAWLVHTSVDWMHLLPGVTGMAIIGAAVLLRADDAAERAGGRTRARRVALGVGAAVLVVASASLVRQTLAEHHRERARDALAERPARALELADRSLALQGDAVGSYYIKAAAFARFGDAGSARAVLREAVEQEPRNWLTYSLLGDLLVRSGDLEGARGAYRRALRLNPLDGVLAQYVSDPQTAVDALRQAPPGG